MIEARAEPRLSGAARLSAHLGIHYAWVVVAVTFLAVLVSAGVRSAPGVLILPFETEFGWDRAAISLGVSLNLVLYGLGAPFGGRLIDRFGPRKVVVVCFLVVAVGCLATLGMAQLWQIYLLWGVVIGLSTGGVAIVMAAAVANRWFASRRGLVTGLLAAGSSAGQLIFIPSLMQLTLEHGWRIATLLMVIVSGVVLVPLLLVFLRSDPRDVGLEPYGSESQMAGASVADAPPTPLATALRKTDFWLLAGSFFICGFTSNGLIGTHLIPHAVESGFTEMAAAGALSLMGLMNVVGTIASGYLCDRFDRRVLLACYYTFRSASLLMLPAIGDLASLWFFAVIFGLDYIATVPPTSTLVADIFGRRSVGAIFGWIFFSHQVGGAAAAYFGGWVRVQYGDYHHAFVSAALVGFMAAAMCLKLPKVRKPVVALAS